MSADGFDKPSPKDACKRNANDTKCRIFSAAKTLFCQRGYSNVGMRDIATLAGVDAALINRYFGSKEKLFDEVLAKVFALRPELHTDISQFGKTYARDIITRDPNGTQPLDILTRSMETAATAEMVSRHFHTDFVASMADVIGGEHAKARAAIFTSYIIGLATMRFALQSPDLSEELVIAYVGDAMQACVDGTYISLKPDSPS